MTQPTYDLLNFRFYDDDNTGEDDQTALGTGNNQTLDRQTGTANRFCARIELYNDNSKSGNEIWQWQYSYDSGAWTDITTSSSIIRAYNSAILIDEEDCTQRLTSNTPYLVDNNGVTLDGLTPAASWGAGDYGEVLLCCYIIDADVADNKTIDLRVIEAADTVTYTNTPNLTVDKPVVPVTINLDAAAITANGKAITIDTPIGEILHIDFEDGDLLEFTSTSGEDISATGAAALVGNYGMSVVADDTDDDYGLKTGLTATNIIRVRFYFDQNGVSMVDPDGFGPLVLFQDGSYPAGEDWIFGWSFQYRDGGDNYRMQPFAGLDDGTTDWGSSKTNLTDEPHYFEAVIYRETADGQADGYYDWWVDGVAQTGATGLENYNIFLAFDRLWAGEVQPNFDTGGTFYIDDIVVRDDDTEIGPATSDITINLDAATITANGKATTIVPAAVTTSLNTAAITANGKETTVVPGAATIDLNASALVSSGKVVSIVPGAASVDLNAGTLIASGPSVSILLAQSVDLAAATITASGKAITVVPSAASVQLDAAAITANGKTITIDIPPVSNDFFPISDISAGSWTTTPLWSKVDDKSDSDYIETSSSWAQGDLEIDDMQDVTSGTVKIYVRSKFTGSSVLFSIELRDSGGSISGPHQPFVTTDWVEYSFDLTSTERDSITDWTDLFFRFATGPITGTSLVSSAYLNTPSSGLTVNLDAASISSSGKSLSVVPGAASVGLDAASISSSGKALSIVPGAASVALDAAAIGAAGQIVSISSGVSINLSAANISSSGKALSVVPGASVVQLDAASLIAAGPAITIVLGNFPVSINLDAANVSSSGKALSIVPGAASITLNAGSVSSSGKSLSIIPGATVVSLSAALVSSSGKALSVVPGAASVSLSVALVSSSGKALSVVPGAAVIILDSANVSAAGLGLGVVPGAVTVALNAAALSANGQTTTISIPIVINLSTATIVAAGQTIGIYTHPRILPGIEVYGARYFVVDASGNGDYTTIQEGINQAQTQTPAADSRWLIRIQAGTYQESLTLYNYIDLAGYGYGHTTQLVTPAAAPAITNGAECTISNLNITGENDPVIQTGDSFTGSMRFVNCVSDNDYDEVILFQLVTGTVEISSCFFVSQGRIFYISTGALNTYRSIFIRDGAESEPPLEIAGAGTVEAHRSSFLNTGAGGGAALLVSTSSPTSVILHHCLFRKASGTYSIDGSSGTPAIYLAVCVANAAIDTAFTGTHDVQVDSNY